MKSYRLTMYLSQDRPDEAGLIEAIEDVPNRSGRRQWLHDILIAGYRKVGSYDHWSTRLRAHMPGVLVPVREPPTQADPAPPHRAHKELTTPTRDGALPRSPHPSEEFEPCDTLNLL